MMNSNEQKPKETGNGKYVVYVSAYNEVVLKASIFVCRCTICRVG